MEDILNAYYSRTTVYAIVDYARRLIKIAQKELTCEIREKDMNSIYTERYNEA